MSLTIHERAQSSGALISSGAPIISGILISSSALIGSSKLGRCKLGRFSLPACRNVAIVFDVRLCECATVCDVHDGLVRPLYAHFTHPRHEQITHPLTRSLCHIKPDEVGRVCAVHVCLSFVTVLCVRLINIGSRRHGQEADVQGRQGSKVEGKVAA